MAIDLRDQQATRTSGATGVGTGPAPTAPRRVMWPFALAVVALLAVGGAIAVFATLEEPAPAGVTMSYPEYAFTAEREGGPYVEQPVAGYTDTSVQIREGGTYVEQPVAGYTDTSVQIREGGPYVIDGGYNDVKIREG